MRGLSWSVCILALLAVSCLPCDCEEATLIEPDVPGAKVTVTFDEGTFPWEDDRFRIRVVRGPDVNWVEGTYEEEGDTIRFDVDKGEPVLSIRSGEINAIDCDEERGTFAVTPPSPDGTPTVRLVFQCTRRG